jgi:hypothetical protein
MKHVLTHARNTKMSTKVFRWYVASVITSAVWAASKRLIVDVVSNGGSNSMKNVLHGGLRILKQNKS